MWRKWARLSPQAGLALAVVSPQGAFAGQAMAAAEEEVFFGQLGIRRAGCSPGYAQVVGFGKVSSLVFGEHPSGFFIIVELVSVQTIDPVGRADPYSDDKEKKDSQVLHGVCRFRSSRQKAAVEETEGEDRFFFTDVPGQTGTESDSPIL